MLFRSVRYSIRAPETPAFKRWFEDSKVVDEDGKPLLVYHGTNAYDELADEGEEAIAQFNSHINWFSPDEYLASGYATKDGRKIENAAIYPAYLSIKNPFVVKGDLNDKVTYAEARKENIASWRIMEKCGMKFLRNSKGCDGETVVYEINSR